MWVAATSHGLEQEQAKHKTKETALAHTASTTCPASLPFAEGHGGGGHFLVAVPWRGTSSCASCDSLEGLLLCGLGRTLQPPSRTRERHRVSSR